MTEYKKLCALCADLCDDVKRFADLSALIQDSQDTDVMIADAYQLLKKIMDTDADATPRVRHIALKARETDPNKQIYNENMCGKIEQLLQDYCAAFVPLLDDGHSWSLPECVMAADTTSVLARLEPCSAVDRVRLAYHSFVLKKAEVESWNARTATQLDQLVVYEEEDRNVVLATESRDMILLLGSEKDQRFALYAMARKLREERWSAEVRRRTAEDLSRRNAAKTLSPTTVVTFIAAHLPDASLQAFIRSKLKQLVGVLVSSPEDMNVRVLRNDNIQLCADFGHPCIMGCEVCTSAYSVSEIVWYFLGYRITYRPDTLSPGIRRGPNEMAVLPCGRPVCEHQFVKMGYEDYAERFLELAEPDADKNPDEWIEWYTTLQNVEAAL